MNRIATLCLFTCLPAFCADQVVLTNGDVITGAIVKKDGAKLTIKSEFLGEVSMPWTAIKSIKSDTDLTVQLPSGESVKGKIATAGDQLQVGNPPDVKTAPLTQVTAVRNAAEQHNYERMLQPRLIDLWAGNFDIGLALARGNARTDTFTTAFTAARVTRSDKFSVAFNQIYGTARANFITSTIASAVRGGWRYNRNVSTRFFVSAMNDYEHDRFQNLDLRVVGGLGGGYNLFKGENFTLDLDAGVDYNRENFMDGLHRNSAEANWGDTLSYRMSRVTSVTQAFHMFNNLSDTGAYRTNFDLGAVTAVRRWLGWHVTASDRFLSNPVQGRQRNDLILSTGFRVSFAR